MALHSLLILLYLYSLLILERINPNVEGKIGLNEGRASNAIWGGNMGMKERTGGKIECN